MRQSVIIHFTTFFLLFVLAENSNGQFSGGDGTQEAPYLVNSAEDLNLIRDYPDAHFLQTSDIDLDTPPWNEEEGWQPIGFFIDENDPDNTPFTGFFDGDSYIISNLFINRQDFDYTGLFGYTVGAQFQNITLEEADITGGRHTGILAGYTKEGTITNCHSSGTVTATLSSYANAGGMIGTNGPDNAIVLSSSSAAVTGTGYQNRYTGGLAGLNHGGTINESFATGDVTGFFNAGGLVGRNAAVHSQTGPFGYITNSYSTGTVTGLYYHTGGLAGSNILGSTITESYSSSAVNGNYNVGGLVGSNQAVITNSHATGNVFARNDYVGGLAGSNRLTQSEIIRCSATGNVHSEGSYTGGLVGYNHQGAKVRQSFASGNIMAEGSRVGGLVGASGNRNDNQASLIEDSYAVGNVEAWGTAGGLTGENTPGNSQPSIFRSYSTGHVLPYGTEVGGLVGSTLLFDETEPEALVIDSFFNTETAGTDVSLGGEGKTTQEMLQVEIFGNWDTETVWVIQDGETYPYLAWQEVPAGINHPQPKNLGLSVGSSINLSWDEPASANQTGYAVYRDNERIGETTMRSYSDDSAENYTPVVYHIKAIYSAGESAPSNFVEAALHSGFAGGTGIPTDPFLVSNADQIFNIRFHRSAHFLQSSDIHLADFTPPIEDENTTGWVPVGDSDVSLIFSGTYDGNGHVISGLTSERPEVRYTGLFGYTRRAVLKNIVIENANLLGRGYTGMLAGQIEYDTHILDCRVSGQITGAGSTHNNSNVGGLVGRSVNSLIETSSSSGIIDGEITNVGGLVGYLERGEIRNSFSGVTITDAENRIGGLLGWNASAGVVINSYSTGSVTGSGGLLGGLVGFNQELNVPVPAVVENSYWDIESSGNPSSFAGYGRTTEEMTYPYATDTFVDWDFEQIWHHDIDGTANSGYPFLQITTATHIRPDTERPLIYNLGQNYPNPFNPVTTLTYSVPEYTHVRITVFNVIGRQVAELVNKPVAAGEHTVQFDASRLSSGVYMYRIEAGDFTATRKMLLVK